MPQVTYRIDGRDYQKSGWFGCQLKSVEWGVRVGTPRVIAGHLMYARTIERNGVFSFKHIISWCLVFPDDKLYTAHDMIKQLYADIEKG